MTPTFLTSIRQTLGSVAVFLLFAAANSQAEELYRVEILIFQNLERSNYQIDQIPSAMLPEYRLASRALVDESGSTDSLPAVSLLPEEQLTLAKTKVRLQRSSAFRPLFLGGWVEDIPSDYRGEPLQVRLGPVVEGMPTIEGTLSIERRRYLHVSAELFFSHFGAPPSPVEIPAEPSVATVTVATSVVTATDSTGNSIAALAEPAVDAAYVREGYTILREKRRMRSKEYHYLDSTEFGVLVYVQPLSVSSSVESGTADEGSTMPDLNVPPSPTEPEADTPQ